MRGTAEACRPRASSFGFDDRACTYSHHSSFQFNVRPVRPRGGKDREVCSLMFPILGNLSNLSARI